MVKWVKNEFWNGYNWFERIFMLAMILLQVILLLFQVMLKMEKMFLYLINKLKNTKKSSMISLLKIQT